MAHCYTGERRQEKAKLQGSVMALRVGGQKYQHFWEMDLSFMSLCHFVVIRVYPSNMKAGNFILTRLTSNEPLYESFVVIKEQIVFWGAILGVLLRYNSIQINFILIALNHNSSHLQAICIVR